MPRAMPAIPEWLRAEVVGRALAVDRTAKVLRGYVVALAGPFKSRGRGEFDEKSLEMIAQIMNAKEKGIKSRFTHPDESNDGLGKFLGRARNARVATAVATWDGQPREVPAVRADLHLDPSSFSTPTGNLGGYILDLAESDPDALSSSLVLRVKQEHRIEKDGTPKTNEKGESLPPLWRPEAIHASDIVDTGDAVDGLLSAGVDVDGLPLAALWRGAELLDGVFAGQPRNVAEARLTAFLQRYLDRRYGAAELTAENAQALPQSGSDAGAARQVERLRRRLNLTVSRSRV